MDNAKPPKKNKKKAVLIAIILLLIAAAGVFVFLNWNTWFGSSNNPSNPSNPFSIDPNAGDAVPNEAATGSASKGIKIPGYPSITIAKDSENVKMALMNPEDNPCYFKFEIILNETGEKIYESQYVPPGKTISDVTLTKPLAQGEYPATIKISTVALDQTTPMNGADVDTVLIAK